MVTGSSSGQVWHVPFATEKIKRTKGRRPLGEQKPLEGFWQASEGKNNDEVCVLDVDEEEFERNRLAAIAQFESDVVIAQEGLLKELEKKNGKKEEKKQARPDAAVRSSNEKPTCTTEKSAKRNRSNQFERSSLSFSIPFHGPAAVTFSDAEGEHEEVVTRGQSSGSGYVTAQEQQSVDEIQMAKQEDAAALKAEIEKAARLRPSYHSTPVDTPAHPDVSLSKPKPCPKPVPITKLCPDYVVTKAKADYSTTKPSPSPAAAGLSSKSSGRAKSASKSAERILESEILDERRLDDISWARWHLWADTGCSSAVLDSLDRGSGSTDAIRPWEPRLRSLLTKVVDHYEEVVRSERKEAMLRESDQAMALARLEERLANSADPSSKQFQQENEILTKSLEEAQAEIARLKKNAVTPKQLDDMRAQLDSIRTGAEEQGKRGQKVMKKKMEDLKKRYFHLSGQYDTALEINETARAESNKYKRMWKDAQAEIDYLSSKIRDRFVERGEREWSGSNRSAAGVQAGVDHRFEESSDWNRDSDMGKFADEQSSDFKTHQFEESSDWQKDSDFARIALQKQISCEGDDKASDFFPRSSGRKAPAAPRFLRGTSGTVRDSLDGTVPVATINEDDTWEEEPSSVKSVDRLEQRAATLPGIASFKRNHERLRREQKEMGYTGRGRVKDSDLDISNVSSLRGFGRYNQMSASRLLEEIMPPGALTRNSPDRPVPSERKNAAKSPVRPKLSVLKFDEMD